MTSNSPPAWCRPWFSTLLILTVAVVAAAIGLLCSRETVVMLNIENGPVEMATALLYFVAAAAVWFLRTEAMGWRLSAALCVLLAAFGARELDLHKYWTGTSVLKLSFYLHDAPLHQKLASAAVLGVIIAALVYLARWLRPLWAFFRRGHAVAVTIAVFIVTMGVTKVIDRSLNILAEDYGVPVTLHTRTIFMSLEETIELGLPLLAILALAQNHGLRKRAALS